MSLGKACSSISNGKWLDEYRTAFHQYAGCRFRAVPHRLRQMIALLKEQAIDFGDLLKGLLYWNDDQKRTQNTWARDFYRT